MVPRAPDLRWARLLLLVLMGLAGPWLARAPQAPEGSIGAFDREGGCVLLADPSGRPCPCERLPGAVRWALGLPLRVNDSEAADLARLPGIGPVRAARIVAERVRHGPFSGVDDLARVSGIGPAMVESLRPYVIAEEPDPACRSEAGRTRSDARLRSPFGSPAAGAAA